MDYHGLNRKELQILCKKHGIPANLKNSDMADRLSSLLKEEKPAKRGKSCLKDISLDVGDEKVLEDKEPKRVKFSPQNETFVFEKTDPRQLRILARTTRASAKSQFDGNPVLVSGIVEDDDDDVGDLEKPGKRTSRRKSIVPNQSAVLEAEKVEPVQRVSRRKSDVPGKSDVLETEKVDKPVQRASRRKSVVPDLAVVLDTVVVDKPVQRELRGKSDLTVVLDTEIVDKPVQRVTRGQSVVPDSTAVSDTEVVDKPVQRVTRGKSVDSTELSNTEIVDKPVGRVLRGKCVVPDSTAVLDTDVVEKPVQKVSRRKAVVTDPIVETDNVEKPAERVTRRKAVVPGPTAETVNVEKPVERVSRRKTIVPDPIAKTENVEKPVERVNRRKAVVSDPTTETENVEKPVERVTRRKAVVPDPTTETENVGEPTERVSRRKAVGTKPTADTENVVEDKPVERVSRRKGVASKPNTASDTEDVDEVEKPAGRKSRRVAFAVKADEFVSSEVVDNVEKPQRLLRRKSVVPTGVVDADIAVKVDKPAQRASKRKGVQAEQNAILDTEIVNNEKPAKRMLRSVDQVVQSSMEKVEQPANDGKKEHVEDVLMSPAMNKAKRSRNGQKEVGQGAVEEVDRPSDEFVGPVGENSMSMEIVTDIPKNDDNAIQADGGKSRTEELLDQAINEKNSQGESPDMVADIGKPKDDERQAEAEETAEFLPNSSEIPSTVQSNDCLEETDVIDKAPDTDEEACKSPIFSGEHTAETSMQSNIVEESLETASHQNIVSDNTSDEGLGSSPPSLLKIDMSGTLFGSMVENIRPERKAENRMEAAGYLHNSSEDPSTVQSSECLEDMDVIVKVLETEIEACNTPINDASLGTQISGEPAAENSMISNKLEESLGTPSHQNFVTDNIPKEGPTSAPSSLLKIDMSGTLFADEKICAAGEPFCNSAVKFSILGNSEARDAGQKQSSSLIEMRDNCISGITERLGFNLSKNEELIGQENESEVSPCLSNSFEIENIAEEENIENSVASDVQSTKKEGTDGSEGSRDVISQEKVVDPMVVGGMTFASNASRSTINKIMKEAKDDEGKTEPPSFNSFLLSLESLIDDTQRALSRSTSEGEKCSQETLRGDVAMDMDEDMKSASNSDCEDPLNMTEREVSDASDPRSAVSCLGVGNICNEVADQIAVADTIVTESIRGFHLKDDKSSDPSTVPQQEIPKRSSMMEERQNGTPVEEGNLKGTPSVGLTCSTNATNLESSAEGYEGITVTKPVEAQCLTSEEDFSNHDQSMDHQLEMVTSSSVEIALFDNLSARAYSVAKEVENLAEEIGHVDETEVPSSPGTELTNCNELDEVLGTEFDCQNSDAKEVEFLAEETGHIDETEGPSSPGNKSPELTHCNELDEVIATEFDCQNYIAMEVKNFAEETGRIGQTEGPCSPGNKSPEFTDCNDFDEVLGTEFDCQNSVAKEVEYCAEETGHIDETDGPSSPGNKSPEFTNCDKPDEVIGTDFDCPRKRLPGREDINEELVIANIDSIEKDSFEDVNAHPALEEGSDNIETSTCGITAMDSNQEHVLYTESKSQAYKNDNDQLDSAKTPDLRHAEIAKDCSTVSEMKQAILRPMFTFNPFTLLEQDTDGNSPAICEKLERKDSSDKIAFSHPTEDNDKFTEADFTKAVERQIDCSTVSEMKRAFLRPMFTFNPFTLLEQDTDGNSPAICEELERKDSSDKVAFSHPTDDNDKFAEADFAKPVEKQIGSDSSSCHAVDNRAEADFSSQLYRHSLWISSYQQLDSSASANQSDTISTVSPAYKDNTALDSAKSPDLRDAQDVEGCSVVSEEKQAFVPIDDTVGILEMVQEASSGNPFITLLEQETGNVNSETHMEDGSDEVIHAGRVLNSPEICENKEGNVHSDEIALSHPTEAQDISSPYVTENFTDQLQPPNQVDPSGSAYQSDTNATALHADADNVNMKSDDESFIFTDSEMNMFWEEFERDEVKKLQAETSDATVSVNEHEIANAENDCNMDANNSGKMAEKDNALMSSMVKRKNARSILIHGTPKKLVPFAHDMKENPPTQKRAQMVNATAVKPNFRRKALDDIAK